jgi:hypothetical protein
MFVFSRLYQEKQLLPFTKLKIQQINLSLVYLPIIYFPLKLDNTLIKDYIKMTYAIHLLDA